MSQLRQYQYELARRQVAVLVITFEAAWVAERYVQETGLPWPLIVDAQRELYRAYGMQRGTTRQVMGLQNWSLYFRLMLSGRRLRRPTGDVFQLGGDVLIDPRGIIERIHVGDGPADRPSIDALLGWLPLPGSTGKGVQDARPAPTTSTGPEPDRPPDADAPKSAASDD